MMWAAIKKAVNGSLGRKDFAPLDEIVRRIAYENKCETIMRCNQYGAKQDEIVVIPWGTKVVAPIDVLPNNPKLILLPDTVEILQQQSMSGLWDLQGIVLPRSLKRIEAFVFANAFAENATVYMMKGIEYIGEEAFYLSKVKSIIYNGTISEFDDIEKGSGWDNNGIINVYCTNGQWIHQ